MTSSDNTQLMKLAGLGLTVGAALYIVSKVAKNKKQKKHDVERLLGIEMGGTSCKIAVITRRWLKEDKRYDYQVVNRHIVNTTSPTETVDKLLASVQGTDFSQIGIASFGPVCLNEKDLAFGNITSTPKEGWQDFALLKYLKSKTLCDNIFIDTDVNAAALAEYELGNHKASSLIYVTVGTGVGVGIVVDGKPVHGLTHPEGGHILVRAAHEDHDFEGVCPFHKNCLEGLVSNNAIAKRFGVTVHDLPKIEENHKVWENCAYYLAQLCLNVTLVVSPEVIVIGGGIMNQSTMLKNIQRFFTQLLNKYVVHPRLQDVENYIKLPTTGADAGILGGAVLCKHN